MGLGNSRVWTAVAAEERRVHRSDNPPGSADPLVRQASHLSGLAHSLQVEGRFPRGARSFARARLPPLPLATATSTATGHDPIGKKSTGSR